MKISVLVPVYNVEPYLQECIESVLNQTYQEFELVLVNDGSTDASPSICDSFFQRYPEKVKVIHKENEGLVLARRTGIAHASGDILMFLDSDDCLRVDALMRIHEMFAKKQCDMVMYNYSKCPDYGNAVLSVPFQDGEYVDKKQLYERMSTESTLNVLVIKAIKKELAANLPDYSQFSHVSNGEDLLASLPLVTNAKKIVYLEQNLYYYRQRQGSIVHSFRPGRARSIKTVHQVFERYIDMWQMPELHPLHYAREVRGWIETAVPLAFNRKAMGRDYYKQEIQQMAEDPYFRNAFEKMDATKLSKNRLTLAKCLYKRNYHRFTLLCYVFRLTDAVRCRLKRFISLP